MIWHEDTKTGENIKKVHEIMPESPSLMKKTNKKLIFVAGVIK